MVSAQTAVPNESIVLTAPGHAPTLGIIDKA
jgi:hypothetical protein